MKNSPILPGILLLLFAVAAVCMLCKAPELAEGIASPKEYTSAYRKVSNAEVTVVSAAKDPEGRRWRFKCRARGRDIVLTMASIKSPYHPETLAAGSTYKLDYQYNNSLDYGRILLVHGKMK